MKTIRILPALLFLSNLFLGTLMGLWLRPFPPPQSGQPLVTLANQQRTILLILVDQMDSQAALVGLWTLIYAPTMRTPTWIPLYPAITSAGAASADELAAHFQLSADLQPSASFLQRLSQTNLAWSGYVVLDGEALAEAMQFFKAPYRPAEWPTMAFAPTQGHPNALAYQYHLLDALCQAAASPAHDRSLNHLYPLLRKHARASFDLSLAFIEWAELFKLDETFSCYFPTR
jgi:hypothetical protein